jgi:uncharacterized membrane protein HdeD (DUF308 family)
MNHQNVIVYFSDQERVGLPGMSRWFKVIGIAMLIMGIMAVILPHVATLAVGILVGLVLLLAGIIYLAYALELRKWRNITGEVFLSALFLLAGILFLTHPFSGSLALTILLAFFFLIHGGFKIPFALAWRYRPGWGWILTSGIISVMLGIIVMIGLPGTALWTIGLILGIDLIFTGVTLLTLGSKLKRVAV